MQLKHRVAVAGVQLDEIDERIMITWVGTEKPKENISTISLMGEHGSRVTNKHRDSIDVTVKFTLRIRKKQMSERETLLERINAWASMGGWLTTNYKPGRRIRVFLAEFATAGDPWEWTTEYSLVFRACGVPYWQETSGQTETQSGKSNGTFTLTNPGSSGTIDVSFLNTSSGTVNTFSITAGESAILLSNLGLASGETLKIDRADNGQRAYLRIRIMDTGGSHRSLLEAVDPESDDDLIIGTGAQTVSFTAQRAGTITVKCIGRFA